jgi:FkbM family methyltransferase
MAWDIRTRAWYEPELDLISKAVWGGDQAVDIGANFGLYSYHLGRAAAPGGSVYAFEPIPWTCAIFTKVAHVLSMHNVRLIRKGCSNSEGHVRFRAPLQKHGVISAGLAHLAAPEEPNADQAQFREFESDVVTLDSFLEQFERLTFIKCDVEGAEALVFEGAVRVLETHQPTVVCEVVEGRLEAFGTTTDKFSALFRSFGYDIYRYRKEEGTDAGRLIPIESLREADGNYTFVHPRYRKRLAAFLPE